jgi:ring-1,2-phenylacetyl-CoA epoxidase subunit PaaD
MITKDKIESILETVCDPEVPVLNIIDLGIVRNIQIEEDKIQIDITPTYSGCPAMQTITIGIRMAMLEHGISNFIIKEVLSPAWTTDWMSESGKQKLEAYGIAPPQYSVKNNVHEKDAVVPCPQCKSTNTQVVSQFGSTSCKALYKCNNCLEPFDYFKCH